MEYSLKKKTVKGVKWTSINTAFNALITPLFYVLLATLLSPSEFAYIAVITLFFRLSPIIAKFGIEEAYIQNENNTNLQNSSLFIFNFLMSLVIALSLYFISPFIEMYYSMVNLSLYIKILTIAVIGEGMAPIFKGMLKKNFLFKENTIVVMISMLLRVTVTIILIKFNFGVISYVIAISISTLFSLITFITISRINTEINFIFDFKLKSIIKFIKFGYPVTGRSFIGLINQRADEILIGAFFSSEVLGVYFFGKNLMAQVRTAITTSFSAVLLPLYTNFKSSVIKLGNAYTKITKITAMVGFPVLVGISLTADIFVPLIFGEKWNDSIIVIQILFVAVMLPIITGNNAVSLLYSLGKPFLVLKIEIISSIIYLVSLWFTLVFGGKIITVLVLFSLFLIINSLVQQYYVNKNIRSNLFIFFKNFQPICISLILMTIFVYMSKNYLFYDYSSIKKLILVILIGITTYSISELIFDRKDSKFLIQNIFKKYISK